MLESIDYNKYPKFKHNLWTTPEDDPEITFLTFTGGQYEVPTREAKEFMDIRTLCTGHHSLLDISKKSGKTLGKVKEIVDSLIEIGMQHDPFTKITKEMKSLLITACGMWAEQLSDTHIFNEFFNKDIPERVFLGFLMETYHYIKAFPKALKVAAQNAPEGELKNFLNDYAQQEMGHESFILDTLVNCGVSAREVEASIPLVSTRTIDLLLKELFTFEPSAVLLVSRIIEAVDVDLKDIETCKQSLIQKYKLTPKALDPFFKHVEIDMELGHGEFLEKKNHLIHLDERFHDIVNKLHDLKHAFDLQKLEILDYYNHPGNYFPRQYVDFFAL
jgi:hypothetical protein